ncbi:MAG: hypothetical protein P8183_08215 [Anaerolineae bacterium]
MVNTDGLRRVGFLFVVALLASCGQLEVGIATTKRPETTVISTETANLTTATATQVVMMPTLQPPLMTTAVSTPTPSPSPTATLTPPPTITQPPPAPTKTAVPVNTVEPSATPVPPPEIHSFTVTPQTVEPGAVLRLNWDAVGDRAEICVFQVGYAGYRSCRETAVAGALSWKLDDVLRDNFAVELTVYRGEQQAGQGLPVTVVCPAAEDWWFFTPAPAGCPAAAAVSTQAAAQSFEHGWMLWLATEDVIYVFFDDNSYARFYGDQLRGDVDTGDGGVEAPAGLVAPVRGFGLVWRGEAEGGENGWVRDRLGWGLAPEFGFQTQVQADQYETFAGIYLRDGEGRIIYIDPSLARWTVYNGLN